MFATPQVNKKLFYEAYLENGYPKKQLSNNNGTYIIIDDVKIYGRCNNELELRVLLQAIITELDKRIK